jgi:hypothetical protein
VRPFPNRKALVGLSVLVFVAAVAGSVAVYVRTTGAPADSGIPELRYAREYPFIEYSTTAPAGRVAALIERLGTETTRLEDALDQRLAGADEGDATLAALLAELDIDASSQLLVFSKTSLQARLVSPATPRAIYFNDDTYVAAIPGAASIEIASMDSRLGPTFFSLDLSSTRIERQTSRCLRCHDSYSLTGGGVPRFMLGSGYIDSRGELVSHEAWILTDQTTPLENRWGGWYVSGHDAGQPHLGNLIVDDPATLTDLDALRIPSAASLEPVLDTQPYLTPYSDIVALLVAEHQIDVHNALTRVSYDVQGLLHGADGQASQAEIDARVAELVEPLVETMLFVAAAPLGGAIDGTSGFADDFERRGIRDAQGRSLRDLDLETRLFQHPVSYLIHSDAFASLPAEARRAALRRIAAVLRGDAADDKFYHLTAQDRARAADILRATHGGIAEFL